MTTPRQDGYYMPAEWHPHTACWMAWPCAADTFSKAPLEPEPAHMAVKECYAEVAKTISRFEPVYVLTNKEDLAETQVMCGPTVNVVESEIDDGWIRDSGPTFVINRTGGVAGVNWVFNGWGNRYPHDLDNRVAGDLLDRLNIERYDAPFVLEGGGIHVDGEGTLLVTESCLLNKNRNPDLSKIEIEDYLREYLGVEKIIWLNGNRQQTDTDGHIDGIASFIKPGRILLATSDDPSHPDYATLQDNLEILKNSTDAKGRPLEIVEITEPCETTDTGVHVKGIYVNYYMANRGIVLPVFDFPEYDQAALEIFKSEFPGYEIVQVPSRIVLFGGGNIHCITQQQPGEHRLSYSDHS